MTHDLFRGTFENPWWSRIVRVNKITSVIGADKNPRELEQYVKVIFRCTCVCMCMC